MELRSGEYLIENCAGGRCVVCKGVIPPGKAVQLSRYIAKIRHVECMPQTDTRLKVGGRIRNRGWRHVT